jgi:hypothetical protein
MRSFRIVPTPHRVNWSTGIGLGCRVCVGGRRGCAWCVGRGGGVVVVGWDVVVRDAVVRGVGQGACWRRTREAEY